MSKPLLINHLSNLKGAAMKPEIERTLEECGLEIIPANMNKRELTDALTTYYFAIEMDDDEKWLE